MVSCYLATVLLAATGSVPDNFVLMDFSAPWCGPCQQMKPVVSQLAKQGYPVRLVDFDSNPALRRKYRVDRIPTLILLKNGQEVGRVVGPTSGSRLRQMFTQSGFSVGGAKASATSRSRSQSPDPRSTVDPRRSRLETHAAQPVNTAREKTDLPEALRQRVFNTTVRIHVQESNGESIASGTIIDARDGRALILTCGHIFRESQGKGQITVDVFGPRAVSDVSAQLLDYDLKRDLGILMFRPGVEVTTAQVATDDQMPRKGDPILTAGCDGGKRATVRQANITGVNRYTGTPNLVVDDMPVLGRSGGGLFNSNGQVIGVCNAADHEEHEGLYASLPAIHALLDGHKLSFVYRNQLDANQSTQIAEVKSTSASRDDQARTISDPDNDRRQLASVDQSPRMPAKMPLSRSDESRGGANPLNRFPPSEREAILKQADKMRDAEVICIVRPLSDPNAKSEVIVLDRASISFLRQLDQERLAQRTRFPTSLTSAHGATIVNTAPSGRFTRVAWQPPWHENHR